MARPKVSGFSIVKNGLRLGYPFIESLKSLAPLCDELLVAHGDSNDGTREALNQLAKDLPCPLIVFDSPWDAKNQKGGSELSRQTNIALEKCSHNICFYIQADEVLHENDYEILRNDIERLDSNADASALVLEWIHFYGNFETIVKSRKWYRREVRVFKKNQSLQSYGDAQGFRIPTANGGWKKPAALLSQARIFHYGWVRPPQTMAQKSEELDRLWHGNARDGIHTQDNVYPLQWGMQKFLGSHPQVMLERVEAQKGFDPFAGKSMSLNLKFFRHHLEMFIENQSGYRIGEFKNYKLL
jgi:glycosyltransferase involved in cell wall biosynthesis